MPRISAPLLLTLFSFAILVLPNHAKAKLLRIIHTNDLHSHFEEGHGPGEGGYAYVAGKINELKAQTKAQGIDVLTLDAGDFFEGGQFYLANKGRESLRIMNAMGYDAVALGNHDWMMGTKELDKMLGEIPPTFGFLAANFVIKDQYKNLKNHLQPYKIFERSGVKIAVLGLTTDDFVYVWPGDGVKGPVTTALKLLPELKKKSDFVIALTHTGHLRDKKLARKSRGLDLIVGGHTHKAFNEPLFVKSKTGYKVPILQAGMHGQRVGDLLVDIEAGKPMKIISYKLHSVTQDGPVDAVVEKHVVQAREMLNQEFGREWLKEVIGHSEVRAGLNAYGNPWNKFVAEAIEEAAGVDAGMHSPAFTYPYRTLGPITREGLFEYYPRIYDVNNNRKGWTIWTGTIKGSLISALVLANRVDSPYISFHPRDGQPLNPFKYYKIAIPESIALEAPELNVLKGIVLRNRKDTGISVWDALVAKLKKIQVIK